MPRTRRQRQSKGRAFKRVVDQHVAFSSKDYRNISIVGLNVTHTCIIRCI